MLNEHELNRLYMPYVSRAKMRGGPTVIQAVIPALLTKNWLENARAMLELIKHRFGANLAYRAIAEEYKKFIGSKPELETILSQRYKEAYDTATAT